MQVENKSFVEAGNQTLYRQKYGGGGGGGGGGGVFNQRDQNKSVRRQKSSLEAVALKAAREVDLELRALELNTIQVGASCGRTPHN